MNPVRECAPFIYLPLAHIMHIDCAVSVGMMNNFPWIHVNKLAECDATTISVTTMERSDYKNIVYYSKLIFIIYWNGIPMFYNPLTHWGRVTHICVGKLTIIGSDNGLSPGRRQAIISSNARFLLIGPFGTKFNFNQNPYIFIQENAFQNVVWKMAAILSRPQCVIKRQNDDNHRTYELVVHRHKDP